MDMGVAGLKAQELKCIETLEQREQERGGLLAELVPAMEARGDSTGARKAVMDG
jgi:hypothetical protein